MKGGEIILGFKVAILKKYPPSSRSVTQIDFLLPTNLVLDMRIRRRGVKNFIFKEVLPSPLCNPITILQIYEYSHFTILLVENDRYYYYDSLGKNNPVSEIVPRIHTALQFSYEDNYEAFSLILQNPEQKKGIKPGLYYTREDAYFLSQAHLHHELTGELLDPCVGRFVDLLTNPSS